MPSAGKSIEINVPIEKFFDIIIDFERYPEFVSDLVSAKVLSRTDDEMQARFELKIIKTIAYTINVKLERPKRMTWNLIKGDLMKVNSGSWELSELPGGRTNALYNETLELSGFVPSAITKKLVEFHLPEMLKQFRERAESLGH